MMSKTVSYEFRDRYSNVIEKGQTEDWRIIRRRPLEIAKERSENIASFAYNEYLRTWDYLGYSTPEGLHYDFKENGPYVLDEDGRGFHKKGGSNERD